MQDVTQLVLAQLTQPKRGCPVCVASAGRRRPSARGKCGLQVRSCQARRMRWQSAVAWREVLFLPWDV